MDKKYSSCVSTRGGSAEDSESRARHSIVNQDPAAGSSNLEETPGLNYFPHFSGNLLNAVGQFARRILQPGVWPQQVNDALGELGKATCISRVSLYQKLPDDTALRCGLWQRADLPDDPAQLPDEVFLYSQSQFMRWQESISLRGALAGLVDQFSEDEAAALRMQHVRSLAIVPIWVDGDYWGMLRLDDCYADHAWRSEEISALQTAADVLSAVIQQYDAERAEGQQRTLAEALRDSAEALTITLELEEVLQRILENVGRVVQHDAAGILLVENGIARVVGCTGYVERGLADVTMGLRLKITEAGNLREMAQTGQPLIIDDVQKSRDWIPIESTAWLRAYVGTPIHIHGRLAGFLGLNSERAGVYTAEDARRLQAFASQAAVAIQNARLYSEARQRARQITAINRMLHFAISASTLNETLQILVEQISIPFEGDLSQLVMWGEGVPEGRFLLVTPRHQSVISASAMLKSRFGEGLTMLRNGEPVVIEDFNHTDLFSAQVAAHMPVRAALALPLWSGGVNIGAAVIGFNHPRHFSPGEIALAEMAANQVSLAIAKGHLLETVKRNSVTDELTGLYNRRGLFELGEREVKVSSRLGRPLSAIMIDLDLFKPINDTAGHLVGDEVLIALATRLRASTREIDVVTRYGGDEFFILLLDSDLRVAKKVTERILNSIGGRPFSTSAGDMQIQCSIGAAVLSPDNDSLSALLERADTALYQAKREGRNRIVILADE